MEFITEQLNMLQMFRKHGLKPNEHCIETLLNVCRLTGDNPELVISHSTEEAETYSRHLLYWKMKEMGYTYAGISRITGLGPGGVRKGVIRINSERMVYEYVKDHTKRLKG